MTCQCLFFPTLHTMIPKYPIHLPRPSPHRNAIPSFSTYSSLRPPHHLSCLILPPHHGMSVQVYFSIPQTKRPPLVSPAQITECRGETLNKMKFERNHLDSPVLSLYLSLTCKINNGMTLVKKKRHACRLGNKEQDRMESTIGMMYLVPFRTNEEKRTSSL